MWAEGAWLAKIPLHPQGPEVCGQGRGGGEETLFQFTQLLWQKFYRLGTLSSEIYLS